MGQRLFYLVLLLIFFELGCSNDVPVSANNNMVLGNLNGCISSLIDTNGNDIKDLSGVRVEAEGTEIFSITDAKGYWSLKGLSGPKAYDIRFSKPGFGIVRDIGYLFYGGVTTWYPSWLSNWQGIFRLIQQPRYSVFLDDLKLPKGTDSGRVIVRYSSNTPDSMAFGFFVLFGRNEKVDPLYPFSYSLPDYPLYYLPFRYMITSGNHDKTHSDTLSFPSYVISEFAKGDTIYCKVFPTTLFFEYGFSDSHGLRQRGKLQYTGYGQGSNSMSSILQ
jgi:hypothetical protein